MLSVLDSFCNTRNVDYFDSLPKKIQECLYQLAINDPSHPLAQVVIDRFREPRVHKTLKGPIRLDIFRKGSQEVYLFYDNHTVLKGSNCSGISLAEFLAETVELNGTDSKTPIDLFLEIPHLYSHYHPNNGYINDVRKRLFIDSKGRPKVTPNLRTYTFDLRWGFDDSYNRAFRGMEKKKPQLYGSYLLEYLTSIEESFARDTFELGIPQLESTPEISETLYQLYLEKVREYIVEKADSIREAVRSKSSKMLEKIFIRLGARYVDYYLLSFLFRHLFWSLQDTRRKVAPRHNQRPPEAKVIIFTGDYHAYNYREFFLLQGWENWYTKEGPQCLDISDLPQPLFATK